MDDAYERRVLFEYALNLVSAINAHSKAAKIVIEWFKDMEETGIIDPPGGRACVPRSPEDVSPALWSKIRSHLADGLKKLNSVEPSPFQENLEKFGRELALDDLEIAILGLAIRGNQSKRLERLSFDLFHDAAMDSIRIQSALLEASPTEIRKRTHPRGRLRTCGILDVHEYKFGLTPSDSVAEALLPPNRGLQDIRRSLLGGPCATDLAFSDFDHLRRERDLTAQILRGALRQRTKGINILVYGPPGTGKTEFCKVVAKRLKLSLYATGETDWTGDDPSRSQRIESFQLAQRLLAHEGKAALLFDEMEDIWNNPKRSISGLETNSSKVFIHRLLETNPIPTLWTANDLHVPGPAVLRRMTLIVEMKTPPPKARAKIWRRHLAEHRLRVPEKELASLAREVDLPPAAAANAVRAVKLAGGGADDLRGVLASAGKALRGGRPLPQRGLRPSRYDPALVNADADIERLIRALAEGGARKGFSLCAYGPPGTGKSAFIRHLAEKMGLEVLQKRASDLFSMWVGGTEKAIARAFEEAREMNAFLAFDEADSLLGDRSLAGRSWEITQVNEMLTWMESHDLPFACTTNLADRLDPASLRRFTLKIKFDFLSATQIRKAFTLYFGAEAPGELLRVRALTPGDFAAVRRRAEVLGGLENPHALTEMLVQECAMKRERARPMGFL